MTATVDFIAYILTVSVPYILAGEGMTLAGRSGMFLISNEGVMLASASATFLVAFFTGNIYFGLVAGALLGALFGVLMGFFTITLKQDQFIVGLGLFILGTGVATMLYKVFIGVTLTPPISSTLKGIPALGVIPLIGPILAKENVMFYFSVLLSLVIWFFLYRTRYGLKVRSVGESPRTADSLGTNVTLVRYAMTILGTAIIALGGAYIPLVFTGTYTDTLISGRGWISILLALFGRWDPRLVLVGAIAFAGVEVSALYAQVLGVPVPNQVLLMIPFIVALIIMVEVYRHAEVPKGLGKNYDRESLED